MQALVEGLNPSDDPSEKAATVFRSWCQPPSPNPRLFIKSNQNKQWPRFRPNRRSDLDGAEEPRPPGPLAPTSRSLQDKSCNMAAQVCLRGRLMTLQHHSCAPGNEFRLSQHSSVITVYSPPASVGAAERKRVIKRSACLRTF